MLYCEVPRSLPLGLPGNRWVFFLTELILCRIDSSTHNHVVTQIQDALIGLGMFSQGISVLVIVILGTWFSRSVPWIPIRDLCVRQLVPRVKSQRNQKPRILAGVSAHSVLLFCFYFFEMGSRCVAQTLLELAMLLSPPLQQAWLIQSFVSKITGNCLLFLLSWCPLGISAL